jgi:hypothetical protein
MRTKLQAALDGITDEQARIVYELIGGFVEDAEMGADDDFTGDFAKICPPAKIEAARALRDKFDAAMASYAEEAA